jgi:hypothetical protein
VQQQKDAVRAWEEGMQIQTYCIGPESPLPPFRRQEGWGIYPYPMQDDLREERRLEWYRAVVLENTYLRVVVLPELGGKVHSVQDRTTGRDVFYRTRVIKPGLIALRGAWVPGGIEFNFPIGHNVTTFSPVNYKLFTNQPDGSVTVWVGCLEHLSRMRWAVGITLHPDRAYLQTEIRVHNRTEFVHPYYFWSNSAVPATDNLRFILPGAPLPHVGGGSGVSYPRWPRFKPLSLSRPGCRYLRPGRYP